MAEINVDFLGKGQAQGEVAGRVYGSGGLNVGLMRPYFGDDGNVYATVYTKGDPKLESSYREVPINLHANAYSGVLRREEWLALDEAILPIAEYRLGGVQDLIDKGLTYNLGNAMGTTVLEHHTVGDAMEADLSMDAVTRTQGDRPVFKSVYLPIPIIHVDYEINLRVLEASRSLGNPLDTTSAERAARRVAEYLENMLFTDTDYSFGGGTIKSYVNFGDRNQVVLTTAWDDSTKTGANIVADVLSWKQESINNFHYGPWMIYIPTKYETVLDKDYDATTPGTTIRERIMKIGGIQGIKVVDTLADDNCLLVQMTSDVVRLVRGFGIQNIHWTTEGGMVNKFKVITIQVPQIRSDQNGRCGIVHAATA